MCIHKTYANICALNYESHLLKMCICLLPFQYITGVECCVIKSASVWYTIAPHSLDFLINATFTQVQPAQNTAKWETNK